MACKDLSEGTQIALAKTCNVTSKGTHCHREGRAKTLARVDWCSAYATTIIKEVEATKWQLGKHDGF